MEVYLKSSSSTLLGSPRRALYCSQGKFSRKGLEQDIWIGKLHWNVARMQLWQVFNPRSSIYEAHEQVKLQEERQDTEQQGVKDSTREPFEY